MGNPTWTPLATTTLTSSSASITFSNIPNTYRDLIIVMKPVPTANGFNPGIRFNSDSGTNYSWLYSYGDGSGYGAATSSGVNAIDANALDGNSQGIYQILDYSATDKHKIVLHRTQKVDQYVLMQASRWANTNAITSVQFVYLASSLFGAGTTFSLYGVSA